LYGVTSVRDRKRVDLVVELEMWDPEAEYDRIGVEDHHQEILNVMVRKVRLPVQPGRNMSSIIEIAARAELLRRARHHPAKDRIDHQAELRSKPPRMIDESSAPPPVHSVESVRFTSLLSAVRPPRTDEPSGGGEGEGES